MVGSGEEASRAVRFEPFGGLLFFFFEDYQQTCQIFSLPCQVY